MYMYYVFHIYLSTERHAYSTHIYVHVGYYLTYSSINSAFVLASQLIRVPVLPGQNVRSFVAYSIITFFWKDVIFSVAFVSLSVSLSVSSLDHSKSYESIAMKIYGGARVVKRTNNLVLIIVLTAIGNQTITQKVMNGLK